MAAAVSAAMPRHWSWRRCASPRSIALPQRADRAIAPRAACARPRLRAPAVRAWHWRWPARGARIGKRLLIGGLRGVRLLFQPFRRGEIVADALGCARPKIAPMRGSAIRDIST